jgi:hypothetical protein
MAAQHLSALLAGIVPNVNHNQLHCITMHVQLLLLVVATCLLSPPECDALPTCQSCIMKLQPLSLTACTTGFHASTCSWEWMPGT